MSIQDVQDAVLLLQSIGVQNICHESDPSWDPILPLCSSSRPSFHLRGSSTRLLGERPEFASVEEAESYYTYNIVGVALCVCGVALIAGLFLGLLTLDVLQLRIILRASRDEDEIRYASTVLPIIEERHLLLVTLLLLNTLLYEALPIFLDNIVPTWAAILLSTTLIMFFGEILPSGIFTGPHQLYLGYRLAPLTRFFLWVMYPFAKPLAMILDCLVHGEEGETDETYNRGELSALVRIQYEDSRGSLVSKQKPTVKKFTRNNHPTRDDSWHATKQELIEKANDVMTDEAADDQLAPPLHPTEVDLIEGALQMKTVVVMDVYTPLSHIYAIADNLVLDRKGFTDIYRMGYSRVPVYRHNPKDDDDKTAILGFLMVRQLMLIDWDHQREVSTLPLQRPKCVSPKMNLVDGLRLLRTNGSLMAFVCARPDLANKALLAHKPLPVEAGFMGIVTLQDVMESLLQERIYDEWDIKDRDRAVATLQKWAATTLQHLFRRKAKALREKRQHALNQPEILRRETAPLLGNNSSGSYQAV